MSELKHESLKIRNLINDHRGGRIVIPEFQREYVWNKSKAPKLIDSLYRRYPISSLLLWESGEKIESRRNDPTPKYSAFKGWLIDGQQRVITLSRILTGNEGIRVVFNPMREEFMLENVATKKDPNWYLVSEIWDDDDYREIRRNLDNRIQEQRFDQVRSILEYEVPVVRMVDYSFKNAVEAFKRVNTLGVRLKAADIESAEVAAIHTGFIKDEVAPFVDRLHKDGFTRLDVMHLFRVCAFFAHPDGRKRTPLHELKSREVNVAWNKTKKATQEALNLIRSEFGLINMDILWSGALLVPIIIHCDLPPANRRGGEICAWMALASLLHRYSGAANTALEQDIRACRENDPIGALLRNLKRDEKGAQLRALPVDFAGKFNDKSALFAMYVACMHRGVKDFYSGGKVLLQPAIDRHHILARGQFGDRHSSQSKADTLANIAFITGTTNRSLNMMGPEVYLEKLAKEIRQSQCITLDSKLYRIDSADKFWAERRKLLAESFNDYLSQKLPNRRFGSGQRRSNAAGSKLPILAQYGVTPMLLEGLHDGKKFKAEILASGEIRFGGTIFDSPSGAACAATGASTNGWDFWRFEKKDRWVPLDHVRKEKELS